jgi:HTH-type transcriptional regulator/antitoxin HipB
MKKVKNLTELLDSKYNSKEREEWELEYEVFKLGQLIEEMRKNRGMTQEELAQRIGTSKSYISRIENNASDLRVNTLLRIIYEGLNGKISLTLNH